MKKVFKIIKQIMCVVGGFFIFLSLGAADVKSVCWAFGLGLVLIAPTVIEGYIEMRVEDKLAEREMKKETSV